MRLRALASMVSSWMLAGFAAAGEVGYYAQPALHGDRLVFVSEGDLFTATVPADPGATILAHRLTTGAGAEGRPAISRDGASIAFTAQYDGNVDVYVMPVEGGAPLRLTFHPENDIAAGFSHDGRHVIFTSPRRHHFGRPELWKVSVDGGMPEHYGFGECSLAALNSSGKLIAFTQWSNEQWTWKGYRGGMAPDIWVGEFASNRFRKLTDHEANDLFPMWIGDRVAFLSDRDDHPNLYSDSPAGDDLRQHTSFAFDAQASTDVEGYDIRWPAADSAPGSTRIVFVQGNVLSILDTQSDQVRRLNVEIASDRVAARRRFVEEHRELTELTLSPDGTKLLVGMRGELALFDQNGEQGRVITATAGARERGAAFLDEDRIAFISDESGEQQIVARLADGETRQLTIDREDWLMPLATSPDGGLIAFADKTQRLHLLDTATTQRDIVDRSDAWEITDYRFSPDSQWLAYVKPMPNGLNRIHLYSVRTKRTFAISDGLHDELAPRFDPKGQYLFYLSRSGFNPIMDDLDYAHVNVGSLCVYALPLAEATPPPDATIGAAAGFDLEAWADPESEEGYNRSQVADPAGEVIEGPMRIDTDGLASRSFRLPIEPANFTGLEAVFGGVVLLREPVAGLLSEQWPPPPPGKGDGALVRFDIIAGEEREIATEVEAFTMNRSRTIIATPTEGGARLLSLREGEEPVDISIAELPLRIDVRKEWNHIFEEAWRLQRDFYFAADMRGADWEAIREKYHALLPFVGTRDELNDLVGEMIGELRTSHTYVGGGDAFEHPSQVNVGLLGADVVYEDGAFRLKRIIRGRSWRDELRSPLAAAHLQVREGALLHAIDGVELAPGDNVYDLLQGRGGERIALTVSSDGSNRRTIEITALESEQMLRYADWVETNRRMVDEQSNGAIGYVHVPDMGGEGLVMFDRYFRPQVDRKALIIDIRNNGGGFVSQMIIDRLSRRVWGFMKPRHGALETFPRVALQGHMAVIIDQHAGSDGDIFPESFRLNQLGPIIGTRTWGGVVGIRGDKPFIDMGFSSQPEFAWWEPTRGWSLENSGVSPDVEVPITPADRLRSVDPQLERTIAMLKEKIESAPVERPAPPQMEGR